MNMQAGKRVLFIVVHHFNRICNLASSGIATQIAMFERNWDYYENITHVLRVLFSQSIIVSHQLLLCMLQTIFF